MQQFPAPYRITALYDALKERAELKGCDVALEQMSLDDQTGIFPAISFDTARVWVRRNGYSVNISGQIHGGTFLYMAWSYGPAGSPWGVHYQADITGIDIIVEHVIAKFDLPESRP